MTVYPTGTVTFLFTDIEQSTTLWERYPTAKAIVERHLAIIHEAAARHHGVHYKTIGDATQSAFPTAAQGVSAALAAQLGLLREPWPNAAARPRVRMALHAGAAEPRDGDYLAGCLNRLSRLLDAAHGEQILISHTVANLAGDALPEGVTLEPLGEHRLRDILQPEEIYQLRHPGLRADFPPLRAAGRKPHNLPVHPTPFLGRARELDEIATLLMRPDVRLVSLTGPGGVGKTRLGLQVAAEALESFPDGAFLVDLARQTDPNLVPSMTATALGLREQAGQTLTQTLADYLRGRQLLLVFDNFEHVLPAATLVADLLGSAPQLKVLATSRARLGLQAEHEYRVETLPVPDLDALPPLETLSEYDAVKLFVARAQALRPGFALTPQNTTAVASIICRLDGLPLAIELAAARVKLLTPDTLLDRLDRRLPTLTGGARDLPARQRTLRDTIAWSHDLLTPAEQILFRRLSVFAGGWTLAAAEAINGVETSEPIDPLQGLAGLVDQSLVAERQRAGMATDETRYGMLETIREFASDQLAASGEADRVERAFEEFLIARVEAAERGLQGPHHPIWLERLEAEHDNLRAALGRVLDREDGNVALGLAPRLWQFWSARGYPAEGFGWLKRALTLPAASERRAAAEFALGKLAIDLGDYQAADEHYRACLALRRELGDHAAEAEALNELAVVAVNTRELDQARELGEEALKLAQAADDRRGIGAALRNLGMVAREQGDYARAIELYGESLALWRRLGDPRWIAIVLSSLGIAHRYAGNAPAARATLDESQALFAQQGDRYMLGVIAHNKGHLAYAAQEFEQAIALYAEALRHFDAVGAPEGVVESIEWLAVAMVAKGQVIPALGLFGSAASARAALHLPPQTVADSKLIAAGQERALQVAGDEGQAALIAGSERSLDQTREDVLNLVGAV